MLDTMNSIYSKNLVAFVVKQHEYLRDMLSDVFEKYPKFSKKVLIPCSIGIATTIGTLIFRRLWMRFQRKRHHIPPGLYGVPIFGSFFTMLIHKSDFNRKILPSYGPISSYTFGNQLFIIINDSNLLKKCFKSNYLVNRPSGTQRLITQVFGFASISTANDNNKDKWTERRKIIQTAVISTANKNFMDSNVKYLMNEFLFKKLDNLYFRNNSTEDRLWYSKMDMRNASFNLIVGALFGNKYQMAPNCKDFVEFSDLSEKFANLFGTAMVTEFLPMLSLFMNVNKLLVKTSKKLVDVIENKFVNEAILKYDANNIETFFDEIYYQFDQLEDKNEITESNKISDKDLMVVDVTAIIDAATGSTSFNLEIALIMFAKYENMQKHIYNELFAYAKDIGNGKYFIELKDIFNCARFRALVHETLRFSSALPRGIPHAITTKKPLQLSFNS